MQVLLLDRFIDNLSYYIITSIRVSGKKIYLTRNCYWNFASEWKRIRARGLSVCVLVVC